MERVSGSPASNSGMLRRRVILSAGNGVVQAALEDDFHCFKLTLEHNGQRVTRVISNGERTPWTTCPGASAQLEQLAGTPVSEAVRASLIQVDPRHQCTHQFDLALMAIAQAARGGQRIYDASVADPVGGRAVAKLERDGQPLIEWQLEGSTIVTPGRFASVNLRKIDLQQFDASIEEGFLLLRRAVMVAGGRAVDLDRFDDMTPLADRMAGACYAFQPVRLALGHRNKGSVRDFTQYPEQLLAGQRPVLARRIDLPRSDC